MLNRNDARMIAEELHKLRLADNPYYGDELLTTKQLAERLNLSESYVRHNAKDWPRLKVGKADWRYPYNNVIGYLASSSV